MIFLVHSETSTGTIGANLGAPEYSYYFVLKTFRPLLEEIALTVAVQDPGNEADVVWRNAKRRGEECIFLSFAPPHRTFLPKECPIIPIFAWEFDTIPTEAWGNQPLEDWRVVLRHAGRAITHSQFAANTVRQAMGKDYDVLSLPAPVWDNFAPLYNTESVHHRLDSAAKQRTLNVRGRVFDTRALDLEQFALPRFPRNVMPVFPEAGPRDQEQQVTLDGVIYTTILCPVDGRKNFLDLLSGFCWAMRDHEDATLVLKLSSRDCDSEIGYMLRDMFRLTPFRCRVVIIDGYLSDESYTDLADISHYAVNASHGEGQCLPLMEYMSAGKPAIAPLHTSTLDYVTPQNTFIVRSNLEPTAWPHDPRRLFKARRHRIDFSSLLTAYETSYQLAKTDPARYAQMAEAAHEGLRPHCSRAVFRTRLTSWLLPQSSLALTA